MLISSVLYIYFYVCEERERERKLLAMGAFL
jgi:hypothetical protein